MSKKGKAAHKQGHGKNKKKGQAVAGSGYTDKQTCSRSASHKARFVTLEDELKCLGLRVKKMQPDGNCFFRAVADQLGRGESEHAAIRKDIVAHMANEEEAYAPFVEDDKGFQAHLAHMCKDASWAGHLEVQAASCCYRCNIHIYQQGQPCWRVINHTPLEKYACLHLSYQDGEHYNSVRSADDDGPGTPRTICLDVEELDGDPSHEGLEGSQSYLLGYPMPTTRHRVVVLLWCGNLAVHVQLWLMAVATFGEKEVRQVAESAYCFDLSRVEQALSRSDGNIGAAVQLLCKESPVGGEEPGMGIGDCLGTSKDLVAGRAATNEQLTACQAAVGKGCCLNEPWSSTSRDFRQEVGACTPQTERVDEQGSLATPLATGMQGAEGSGSTVGSHQQGDLGQMPSNAAVGGSTDGKAWAHCAASSQTQLSSSRRRASEQAGGHEVRGRCNERGVCLGKVGDTAKRVGRNKKCPCGSGEKFKNCCRARALDSNRPKPGPGVPAGKPAQLSTLDI